MGDSYEAEDQKLISEGWYISPEGLELLMQNGSPRDVRILIKTALDIDLKEIGRPILSEQLALKCVDNVVLQIQKIRNIAAPKANEESQAAPRMLKLSVTDGHNHCQAIEVSNIASLSLQKTAPGVKVLLKKAPVCNGFIFVKPENLVVLGGNVSHLYEKWELNKNMTNYKRGDSNADGPPAWVNFGKKIIGTETKDFKSLEDKTRDDDKPTEFDVQRNVAIAEAASGAVKKFGGGMKTLPNDSIAESSRRELKERREPRDRPTKSERRKRGEPRDKDDIMLQKPSDKVSLFAFLEDKLQVPSEPTISMQNAHNNHDNQRHFPNHPKQASKPYATNEYNNYAKQSNTYPSRRSNNAPPPRLQNKVQHQNASVEELSDKMDRLNVNASFARNAFKQHLNLPNHIARGNNSQKGYAKAANSNPHANHTENDEMGTNWKWSIGDLCLAKYWEDNKYYNATITGLTTRTCVVQFNEYGNVEEVLFSDCLPISSEEPQQASPKLSNGNENRSHRNFVNRSHRRF